MVEIDRVRLHSGAAELEVELSDSQLDQFGLFADVLHAWNQRMNLTRILPEDFVTLHFLDSLLALSAVNVPTGARIVDVGTGAGFPGIPIKIARPDVKVTLLDSTRKKLTFVDEVIHSLGL